MLFLQRGYRLRSYQGRSCVPFARQSEQSLTHQRLIFSPHRKPACHAPDRQITHTRCERSIQWRNVMSLQVEAKCHSIEWLCNWLTALGILAQHYLNHREQQRRFPGTIKQCTDVSCRRYQPAPPFLPPEPAPVLPLHILRLWRVALSTLRIVFNARALPLLLSR